MEEKITPIKLKEQEKDLFAGKYEIVGKGDFTAAVKKLLGLSHFRETGSSYEVLYKLNSVPTDEDLVSLVESMESGIEIGVLSDRRTWFLVRGFSGGGWGLTGRFLMAVPEGGIFFHTHPGKNKDLANPSIFDVAYATKKETVYGIIGRFGLTEYTCVEKIKGEPYDPKDPEWLIEVFRDDFYDTSVEEQQRVLKKMGMKTKRIPWGEGAKKYWDKLMKRPPTIP